MALIVTNRLPDWSPKMAEETGAFLASNTGKQLLQRLLYLRPVFSGSADPNKRLIESGIVEGYEQALIELQKLTELFPNQ